MTEAPVVLRSRISKSCDECKARKVRCIRARPDSLHCNNCLRRNQTCHFSQTKRKLKVKDPVEPSSRATSLTGTNSPPKVEQHDPRFKSRSSPPKLYIDRILENRETHGVGEVRPESCLIKAGESFVTSCSLSFFSESRIRSLTERIGHNRLRELIETFGSLIDARMNPTDNDTKSSSRYPPITFKGPTTPVIVPPEAARAYVAAYFKQIHPIHPFLDRAEFEQKAFSYDLMYHLSSNASFSALYHTVLALGAQYTEGGSFDAGQGKPWKLYQVALGLFSDILLPRESLVNLQALTAMSIFAQNLSCLQIEQTLITEATRMAIALGFNRSTMNVVTHRNFWVVYILEKTFSFFGSCTSSIRDADIGCPIPDIPEAVYGGVDWFYLSARFARLVSRAYEMLYTVSATTKTHEEFYESIDIVYQDLENWRLSVPKDLRPGELFRPENCKSPWTITVSLRGHFFYSSVVMSLCRLILYLGAGTESPRIEEAKNRLMYTARNIIELTHYVDLQPHTSNWILGVMPVSALFVLFDFVVHNPYHPESSTNLKFLDVVGAYFTRVEYAVGGSLPTSLMAEFAIIARQFIRDIQLRKSIKNGNTNGNPLYRQSTREGQNTEPIKFYDQVREANQALMYPPSQIPQVEQIPGAAHQILNGGSLPYAEQLFYPTDELQPFVTGDLGSGFDMTGLFDSVLPTFQF